MSPAAPRGLVHSIQARLKNQALRTGRPYVELLELFALERFLYRLARSRHRDRFVLKGALLLRHWLGADSRPTRDSEPSPGARRRSPTVSRRAWATPSRERP